MNLLLFNSTDGYRVHLGKSQKALVRVMVPFGGSIGKMSADDSGVAVRASTIPIANGIVRKSRLKTRMRDRSAFQEEEESAGVVESFMPSLYCPQKCNTSVGGLARA